MQPFASQFESALERANLSQREFARLIPCNSTLVSKVIKQQRTPPIDALERWIEVLQLTVEEREPFRVAALLAHAPDELFKRWTDMENRLAKLTTHASKKKR